MEDHIPQRPLVYLLSGLIGIWSSIKITLLGLWQVKIGSQFSGKPAQVPLYNVFSNVDLTTLPYLNPNPPKPTTPTIPNLEVDRGMVLHPHF